MESFDYGSLVNDLTKSPTEILNTLTPEKVDMIHAVLGISGEAGELLDAIKKHVIYGQPLDLDNVIEELGDLEFYMQRLRYRLQIPRHEIITKNADKLRIRYGRSYSDKSAQQRRDKTDEQR